MKNRILVTFPTLLTSQAHTIRYCPRNRGNTAAPPSAIPVPSAAATGVPVIYREEASITELKRMRSATGRPRPLLSAPQPPTPMDPAEAASGGGGTGGGAAFQPLSKHFHRHVRR